MVVDLLKKQSPQSRFARQLWAPLIEMRCVEMEPMADIAQPENSLLCQQKHNWLGLCQEFAFGLLALVFEKTDAEKMPV